MEGCLASSYMGWGEEYKGGENLRGDGNCF